MSGVVAVSSFSSVVVAESGAGERLRILWRTPLEAWVCCRSWAAWPALLLLLPTRCLPLRHRWRRPPAVETRNAAATFFPPLSPLLGSRISAYFVRALSLFLGDEKGTQKMWHQSAIDCPKSVRVCVGVSARVRQNRSPFRFFLLFASFISFLSLSCLFALHGSMIEGRRRRITPDKIPPTLRVLVRT